MHHCIVNLRKAYKLQMLKNVEYAKSHKLLNNLTSKLRQRSRRWNTQINEIIDVTEVQKIKKHSVIYITLYSMDLRPENARFVQNPSSPLQGCCRVRSAQQRMNKAFQFHLSVFARLLLGLLQMGTWRQPNIENLSQFINNVLFYWYRETVHHKAIYSSFTQEIM